MRLACLGLALAAALCVSRAAPQGFSLALALFMFCIASLDAIEPVKRQLGQRQLRVYCEPPNSSEPERVAVLGSCCVCKERAADSLFPCGHRSVCLECATQLPRCPLCREAGSACSILGRGPSVLTTGTLAPAPPVRRRR